MTTKPTNPKPRRRWLQFSLRTFFVLLTVACVGLALFGQKAYRANEQQKAVAWVREMGGYAFSTQRNESGFFLNDGDPRDPKWLVQLLGVDYFQEVFVVSLSNTQVVDLAPISKLTRLQGLELNNTPVSDLTPLASLKNLWQLLLHGTQVRDVTPLASLKNLEVLNLSDTLVSEEQVKKLQQALPNCKITWSPADPSP